MRKQSRTIKPNQVVIMAGGRGVRLRPLTKFCPKPMIKVAGRPILETIIRRLMEQGFSQFYISINYLGGMIENYFGDGQGLGCQIKYLKEKKYLHTGGSLSLIPNKINEPLIVMNGDLITKIDFDHLLNFHEKGNFEATICVQLYNFKIPYGIIKEEHNRMISFEEKPTRPCLINAGIYILNPETLGKIPKNQIFPITKLFEKLLAQKKKVGVYQMKEAWLDVGHFDELKKAQQEYLLLEKKCLQNSKKS